MKSAPTFLDAGWDFLDETDNGTDDELGINSLTITATLGLSGRVSQMI